MEHPNDRPATLEENPRGGSPQERTETVTHEMQVVRLGNAAAPNDPREQPVAAQPAAPEGPALDAHGGDAPPPYVQQEPAAQDNVAGLEERVRDLEQRLDLQEQLQFVNQEIMEQRCRLLEQSIQAMRAQEPGPAFPQPAHNIFPPGPSMGGWANGFLPINRNNLGKRCGHWEHMPGCQHCLNWLLPNGGR
jgi:hypothetical protein